MVRVVENKLAFRVEVWQKSVLYLTETIRTRDDVALHLASEYVHFDVKPDNMYVIL
jgi:hypothetical protein